MKTTKKIPLPALVALLACASLSACGGGGNESGPPDSLLVSTANITMGTSGNCVVGTGPEVHVFGGTPPYRLSNSVPQGMSLNKTLVQNSGDSFVITFINGVCMTTMPITIEDQMGRITQVLVSNGV